MSFPGYSDLIKSGCASATPTLSSQSLGWIQRIKLLENCGAIRRKGVHWDRSHPPIRKYQLNFMCPRNSVSFVKSLYILLLLSSQQPYCCPN